MLEQHKYLQKCGWYGACHRALSAEQPSSLSLFLICFKFYIKIIGEFNGIKHPSAQTREPAFLYYVVSRGFGFFLILHDFLCHVFCDSPPWGEGPSPTPPPTLKSPSTHTPRECALMVNISTHNVTCKFFCLSRQERYNII